MKQILFFIVIALILTACGEVASPPDDANAEIFLTSTTIQAEVDGMHCGGCEASMCAALQDLPGVAAVKADHKAKHVTVALEAGASMQPDQLAEAIRAAKPNYTVGEVVMNEANAPSGSASE